MQITEGEHRTLQIRLVKIRSSEIGLHKFCSFQVSLPKDRAGEIYLRKVQKKESAPSSCCEDETLGGQGGCPFMLSARVTSSLRSSWSRVDFTLSSVTAERLRFAGCGFEFLFQPALVFSVSGRKAHIGLELDAHFRSERRPAFQQDLQPLLIVWHHA